MEGRLDRVESMEATRRKRSELFQFVERHRVGQNHGDLDDGAIMAARSRRESVDLGPDASVETRDRDRRNGKRKRAS